MFPMVGEIFTISSILSTFSEETGIPRENPRLSWKVSIHPENHAEIALIELNSDLRAWSRKSSTYKKLTNRSTMQKPKVITRIREP